jgi:biopolymer transport protein ExbD
MATEENQDVYVKKQRKKKPPVEETAGVQMTSLMDIMTILLVFLLVSITSDPLNIQQNDDLVLAKSTADDKPKDSIPVTVNKRSILADKALVAQVSCKLGAQPCSPEDFSRKAKCAAPKSTCAPDEQRRLDSMYFYVDKRHKEDGSDKSYLIEPLQKELEKLVKQQKEENALLQNKEFEGITIVICDESIPFRLLTELVYSAGKAGLYDIRFAILKTASR